jgi:hypothetical protein
MPTRGTDRNGTDIFDLIADIVVAREEKWRQNAACRGANIELFFPKQTIPSGLMEARKYCDSCTVQKECRSEWEKLPSAMQRHGIWFGSIDRDRRL